MTPFAGQSFVSDPAWRAQGFHQDEVFGDVLAESAAAHHATEFWWASGRGVVRSTIGQVYRDALRFADALRRMGYRAGDLVATMLPNGPEQAALTVGALASGLVVLPIVQVYGARELGHILAESGARMFVVPRQWRKTDFVDLVARTAIPATLEHVVHVGAEDGDALGSGLRWQDLPWSGEVPPRVSLGEVRADEICLLLYTSGTGSTPKGVLHTHNSLLSGVRLAHPRDFRPSPERRHFSPSPSGHVASLLVLLRAIVCNRATAMMDWWNVDIATDTLEEFKPTFMNGSPIFYTSIFDLEERRGTASTYPLAYQTGGAGVGPNLIARGDATGRHGWRTYGSSETPSLAASTPFSTFEERSRTEGRPSAGALIRVVDALDQDVSGDAEGEVLIKAPQMFVGYADPVLNTEAFAAGGWFRSGDIGMVDAAGNMRITGRKKEIIIRGGENLAINEIEHVLVEHRAVADGAVTAVPDELMGERVCAVVRLAPGAALDLDSLKQHFVHSGLSIQKAPERLVIVDTALPRTASGKLIRAEVNRLATPETRSVS